jgi:hypothetical protein
LFIGNLEELPEPHILHPILESMELLVEDTQNMLVHQLMPVEAWQQQELVQHKAMW